MVGFRFDFSVIIKADVANGGCSRARIAIWR
jgi:hypothetical protein